MTRARTDANQSKIIRALEQIGCTVADTSAVGIGFPDIVVGFRGRSLLIEIKDGAKPPSKRKLTPDQQIFKAEWRGQYAVVKDVDEAIAVVTQETIK